MKADLTRDTFHSFKHFTRVLMQQGRVQLDADWNEQAAILLNFLQALAADLIGPYGGPIANLGFQIAGGSLVSDFAISPGHYYVDGILCELAPRSAPVTVTGSGSNQFNIPSSSAGAFAVGQVVLLSDGNQRALTTITAVSGGLATVDTTDTDVSAILKSPNPVVYPKPITYLTQPDFPVPSGTKLPPAGSLAYLDVWERLVTYVQDDSIREVALGGADTAARSKLVCQVKLWPGAACGSNLKSKFQPMNRGSLQAQAKQASNSTDPCVIAPNASYRGPENQLYRVEIHSGGTYDGVNQTFKWSRENGSVVFPIVNLSTAGGNTTVVLENLGRDDRFGLSAKDWVEIEDDHYVLQNSGGMAASPETLLQVQQIDTGNLTVILTGTPPQNVGTDQARHPLLRRWDQTCGNPDQGGLVMGPDNAALIQEAAGGPLWLDLEDGIQIQFQPAPQGGTNQYRTGDYWLIPARTATGDVQWPRDKTGAPLALPPDGVDHHYAPLSDITVGDSLSATTCQFAFSSAATGVAIASSVVVETGVDLK